MPKGINIFRAVDNVQLFEMTYTRAGYSVRTADKQGWQLLEKQSCGNDC